MERNILWIHGWGMSSQVWDDVSALLPGVKHHYFTFAGCDIIESFHKALKLKLESAGTGENWTLIGWSLGGMLAIEQWIEWQDQETSYKLEALIIIAGSLRFENSNRSLGWPVRVIDRMQKQLKEAPQEILQHFAQSMFSESDKNSARYAVNAMTLGAISQDTDFSLSGLDAGLAYLRTTDLNERWHKLRLHKKSTRLLWIHGTEDPICLIAGMPPLELEEKAILPTAGHAPFMTDPELFYEKIRSFLDADRSDSTE
jgi:pimeloyl-[acyl-carrier protein] methyl ester esterase